MFELSYLSIIQRIGYNLEELHRSYFFQILAEIVLDYSYDLVFMFQLEKSLICKSMYSRLNQVIFCWRQPLKKFGVILYA